MKPRTWRIDNRLYNYSLFVRFGGTLEESNKWIEKKFGGELGPLTNQAKARSYFRDDDIDHAIWFDAKCGAVILSHESLHSVAHVMRCVGVDPMCHENEEAYAYLLSWTVGEIGSRIWGRSAPA